jgi:hypothetical protein
MRYFILLTFALSLVSCCDKSVDTPEAEPERIQMIEKEKHGVNDPVSRIFRDSKTGAEYLVMSYGHGLTIVKLEN